MQVGLHIAQALLDVFVACCMLIATLLPAAGMLLLKLRMDADPDIVRFRGAVVDDERAFDEVSPIVGRYEGRPIYGEVVFKSLRYRYAGIAPPARRNRAEPNELVFASGIVYRAID